MQDGFHQGIAAGGVAVGVGAVVEESFDGVVGRVVAAAGQSEKKWRGVEAVAREAVDVVALREELNDGIDVVMPGGVIQARDGGWDVGVIDRAASAAGSARGGGGWGERSRRHQTVSRGLWRGGRTGGDVRFGRRGGWDDGGLVGGARPDQEDHADHRDAEDGAGDEGADDPFDGAVFGRLQRIGGNWKRGDRC